MKCELCGKFCSERFIYEPYDYYAGIATEPLEYLQVCKQCKEAAGNG